VKTVRGRGNSKPSAFRCAARRLRAGRARRRGTQATTRELASWLQGWMAEGASPAFVIGGADGLNDSVKARADKLLACRN